MHVQGLFTLYFVFMFCSHCSHCCTCDSTSAHCDIFIGSDTSVATALLFQEEIYWKERKQLYVKIATENI